MYPGLSTQSFTIGSESSGDEVDVEDLLGVLWFRYQNHDVYLIVFDELMLHVN